MGGSTYSDDHYKARVSMRAASNIPTFKHDHDVRTGKVATALHKSLDPKGLKFRESRDSDAHPESNAVIFAFDVTGSMGEFPIMAQKKLPTLMGLLLRKSYLTDPQICVCAFGDYYGDRVPLQVGQFESGIEIEDCLTNLYLEGGGGGQKSESPELVLYFAARHTSIDCFEKRQKKGYLFIVTDEMGRIVSRQAIEDVFGEKLEADIPIEVILEEAQKMYEVFVVMPKAGSYWTDPGVNGFWKKLLGERFLKLEESEAVCELVAATIGLCEESVDHVGVTNDLVEAGLSENGVRAVTTALAKPGVKPANQVAKVPIGSGLAPI